MPTERVPQIPDDLPTPRVDFIEVATEGWAYTGSLVLDERGPHRASPRAASRRT